MKVTYDATVDAAYIYLAPDSSHKSVNTYACDFKEVGNNILALNFDSNFVLLGVEIHAASTHLHPDLLRSATKIG